MKKMHNIVLLVFLIITFGLSAQNETSTAGELEYKESLKYQYQPDMKLYWLNKAIDKGNSDALNDMGNIHYGCYASIKGANYIEAQKYWKLAADKNNSNGHYNLGVLYIYGQGFKRDFSKGVSYWSKAAELGNLKAMEELGNLYFNKIYIPRDPKNAVVWYQMALNNGVNSVIPNLVKAEKMVEAENDLKNASLSDFDKGKAYFELEKYQEAIVWFEKAAKDGNDKAMTALGVTYETLKPVFWVDEAAKWYKKASGKGNEKAMYLMGKLIQTGKYENKGAINYAKAKEWFEKAAQKNDLDAMVAIGWMYYNGTHDLKPRRIYNNGGKQKFKAWDMFKKAADLGSPQAYYGLGYLLDNEYVYYKDSKPVNFEHAGEWYLQASDLGDEKAKDALKKFNQFLPYRMGEKHFKAKNYVEAKEWFDKAEIEKGDNRALIYLAEIYENGLGIEKDIPKAFKYYYRLGFMGDIEGKMKAVALFDGDKMYAANIETFKTDIKKYQEDVLKKRLALQEKIKKDKEDYQQWIYQKKIEELNRPSVYQSVKWEGFTYDAATTASYRRTEAAYKQKVEYNNYVRYLDYKFGK